MALDVEKTFRELSSIGIVSILI